MDSKQPEFTKEISLADVRYVIDSRQSSVMEMLARVWGIALTIGFLFAIIVRTYSYLDL